MSQEALERSLKDVLEDRGVIPEVIGKRAEIHLKMCEMRFGVLSYEECMKLVEENSEILKYTPQFDPAHVFLSNSISDMLGYATALNDKNTMGKTDHLLKAKLLVSVNETTVECELSIPRRYYSDWNRKKIIGEVIRFKINHSANWRGSLRQETKIDFVEL